MSGPATASGDGGAAAAAAASGHALDHTLLRDDVAPWMLAEMDANWLEFLRSRGLGWLVEG